MIKDLERFVQKFLAGESFMVQAIGHGLRLEILPSPEGTPEGVDRRQIGVFRLGSRDPLSVLAPVTDGWGAPIYTLDSVTTDLNDFVKKVLA